jgi:hypothetical protein
MPMKQRRRYCWACQTKTLHAKNVLGLGWGLLLTLLTAGVFLPVWLLLSLFSAIFIPYRCQDCGKAKVI